MYIRESRTVNKKTGKIYYKHQLVETIQTEKGPRNRVLLHLGALLLDKEQRRRLARIFEARISGNSRLSFAEEAEPELIAIVEAALEKNKPENRKKKRPSGSLPRGTAALAPQSIEVDEVRTAGAEHVVSQAWERMGMDGILLAQGFSLKERALALATVAGRLISPGSERATYGWLTKRSALGEMVGGDLLSVGKDALYAIGDRLWRGKEALETALAEREETSASPEDLVLLYDMSNTYFEGNARGNDLAKRGHSKEKRSDCPLVSFSLVVDQKGRPIASRIDPGNQSEPETLPQVLDRLEALLPKTPLFPAVKPTLVMDRGIATRENVALIKKRGFPYCVVERRPVEKQYRTEFETAKTDFAFFAPDPEDPDTGVWLKKVLTEEGTARALVLSESRKVKEEAMDSLKEKRFLEDLEKFRTSIRKGTVTRAETVLRRLGRLEAKYPTVARYYAVTPVAGPTPAPGAVQEPKPVGNPGPEPRKRRKKKTEEPTGILPPYSDLLWEKRPKREERKTLTGAYVIETTHADLPASGIWSLYTTLTQVEDAFRSLKSELGIRPVFHQTANRTRAHLFISVLAYYLLSNIECRLREKGETRSWATLRNILSTIVRTTVTGTDPYTGILYRIRTTSRPDPEQQEILKRLEVTLPTRKIVTRQIPDAVQM